MTSPGCIEFHSVDVPVPAEGQVLVRIHQIGVCGSDIHVYHGKHPFTKYPVTQGHEVSAEVISLGNPFQGKETVCDADGNPITVGEKVTIVATDKRLGDKLTYAAKLAENGIVVGENEAKSGTYEIKKFN